MSGVLNQDKPVVISLGENKSQVFEVKQDKAPAVPLTGVPVKPTVPALS